MNLKPCSLGLVAATAVALSVPLGCGERSDGVDAGRVPAAVRTRNEPSQYDASSSPTGGPSGGLGSKASAPGETVPAGAGGNGGVAETTEVAEPAEPSRGPEPTPGQAKPDRP